MDWKIGEIRQVNGEWYQCVEQPKKWEKTVCDLCPFHGIGNCELDKCSGTYRNDKKSVIFKKLEKVGEPFERNCYLYQEYKAHTYPLLMSGDAKIPTTNGFAVIIKQNKEDMEEKKDNYDGYMDAECIAICDALNSIPDVRTTESCCGHCKDRFMIFLTCDNSHSLAIIARVFDRRYIGTSQPWYVELQTKDSGSYDYFIHSETKYDSEEVMMKDINQIIENIKYWCDDKFASHFKGCDDKPTLAPFDINLAKQGKPVCTRDGRKARIICFDAKGDKPIIALVEMGVAETPNNYPIDGKAISTKETPCDLMMLPEKKEGWVNIYRGQVYNTFEKAEEARKIAEHGGNNCLKTIKIDWEE